MSYMAKRKIEAISLSVLQSEIDKANCLEHNFNKLDKEMCWDGTIEMYTGIGEFSKKTFEDQIPVQIKGHIDTDNKYLGKDSVSLSVDLDDLRVFLRARGSLYFSVFVSKDLERNDIYYISLFPSKIKGLLEEAQRRKNKRTLSVRFNKLERDGREIYYIVRQFSKESRKQGFGEEQIVQNMIRGTNLDNIKSIQATAVGAENEDQFLERLSKGDVCFYGELENSFIELPMESRENSVFYMSREVKNIVSVEGKAYYKVYKYISSSEGQKIIELSPNLQWDVLQRKMTFIPKTTISDLDRDAKFLLELDKYKTLLIGESGINLTEAEMDKGFKEVLGFYVHLRHLLDKIKLEYKVPFELINEESKKALRELVLLSRGKNAGWAKGKEGMTLFKWVIDEKYYPILVFPKDEAGQVELKCVLDFEEGHLYMTDTETGELYKIPPCFILESEVLCNLYEYRYESFYKQFDESDLNNYTVPYFNTSILEFISAYDAIKEKGLLDFAEYVLKMLKDEDEDIYILINYYQVLKRKRELDNKEIALLHSLLKKQEEQKARFALLILLDMQLEAKEIYEGFSRESKEQIKQFPIYKLLE